MRRMIPFLIAISLIARLYHQGQWSKWYRIGCLADLYLRKWYGIEGPENWMSSRFVSTEYKIEAREIMDDLIAKYHAN